MENADFYLKMYYDSKDNDAAAGKIRKTFHGYEILYGIFRKTSANFFAKRKLYI
jgi:hypothetical protein